MFGDYAVCHITCYGICYGTCYGICHVQIALTCTDYTAQLSFRCARSGSLTE
jgi:hypothetical protein